MSWSFRFSLTLLLSLFTTGAEGGRHQFPYGKLGFEVSEQTTDTLSGRTLVTDRAGGYTVEVIASPSGQIKQIRLSSRREEIQLTTFSIFGLSVVELSGGTIRTLSTRKDTSYQERINGRSFRLGLDALDADNWGDDGKRNQAGCQIEASQSSLEDFLESLNWLAPFGYLQRGDQEYGLATRQFLVHRTCSTSQEKLSAFQNKINEAVQRGLSCWSKLGNSRRIDAGKLIGLLEGSALRKVAIHCATAGDVIPFRTLGFDLPGGRTVGAQLSGIAVTCASPIFPAVFLTGLDPEDKQFTKIVFHELSHLLGFVHSPDRPFDVPRLSEQCCFDESGEIGTPACRALAALPSS